LWRASSWRSQGFIAKVGRGNFGPISEILAASGAELAGGEHLFTLAERAADNILPL
jgi:hypothetical protein